MNRDWTERVIARASSTEVVTLDPNLPHALGQVHSFYFIALNAFRTSSRSGEENLNSPALTRCAPE